MGQSSVSACWHQSLLLTSQSWLRVICWPPLSEENRRKQFSPPPSQSPPSLLPENEDGLRTRWDIETVCSYKLLMSLLMTISLNDAFTVFQSPPLCKVMRVSPVLTSAASQCSVIWYSYLSSFLRVCNPREGKQLGKSGGKEKVRGQQKHSRLSISHICN